MKLNDDISNEEEEEMRDEWEEKQEFWNVGFKGHASDGRYKMENMEEEEEEDEEWGEEEGMFWARFKDHTSDGRCEMENTEEEEEKGDDWGEEDEELKVLDRV